MEIVIPVAIESYGILPFNKPLKTSLLFDCMCSLRNLASLLQLSLAERAGRKFDSFLAVHCYRSSSLGVPGACSEHAFWNLIRPQERRRKACGRCSERRRQALR